MKSLTLSILLGLSVYSLYAQDFGCYTTESLTGTLNPVLAAAGSSKNNPLSKQFEVWDNYSRKDIKDEYYIEYYPSYPDYPKQIKMEGLIKNGKREGKWKLYFPASYQNNFEPSYSLDDFYCGNYINGIKEGIWKLYGIKGKKQDTVIMREIPFTHDKVTGMVRYWSGKNLYEQVQYINDTLNGFQTFYFPDGKKRLDANYINGKQEGEEIAYLEQDDDKEPPGNILKTAKISYFVNDSLSGTLTDFGQWRHDITIENYSHGKKQGQCTYFNKGFISRLEEYNNGKLDGNSIYYYDSGKIETQMIYKNGLPYTIINQFSPQETMLDGGTLKDGNGILKGYHNGFLQNEFTYKNQILEGPFTEYYDSGKLECAGIIHSIHKEHYPDYYYGPLDLTDRRIELAGGTLIKGYYSSGELRDVDSIFNAPNPYNIHELSYFTNGKIHENWYLDSNKISGHYTRLYDNGQLECEVFFKIDSTGKSLFNGIQKYYFENGKLRAVIDYTLGILTGQSLFYDEDGKLMREYYACNDGSEYNVFNNDTVNRLDKHHQKQGKWISLPQNNSSENTNNPCNIEPVSIEYYKDGRPTGTWLHCPNLERFYTDSIKLVWADSVKAYYINYTASDCDFNDVREEGYILDQHFRIGTWKEYAKGKNRTEYLEWEGNYVNGYKEGKWTKYKENGKVKSYIIYKEGDAIKE